MTLKIIERKPNHSEDPNYFGEVSEFKLGTARHCFDLMRKQKTIANPNPNSPIKEIVIGLDSNNTKLVFADSDTFDEENRNRIHLLCGPKAFLANPIPEKIINRPEMKPFWSPDLAAHHLVEVLEYMNFTPDKKSYYERPIACLLSNKVNLIAYVISKSFAEPEFAKKYLDEASRDRAEKIARSLEISPLQNIFNKIATNGLEAVTNEDYSKLEKLRLETPIKDNLWTFEPEYSLKTGAFYKGSNLTQAIVHYIQTFSQQIEKNIQNNFYNLRSNPFVKFSSATNKPAEVSEVEMKKEPGSSYHC